MEGLGKANPALRYPYSKSDVIVSIQSPKLPVSSLFALIGYFPLMSLRRDAHAPGVTEGVTLSRPQTP